MHTEHLLWADSSYNPVSFAGICLLITVPTVGQEEVQARGRDSKTQSSQRPRQDRNSNRRWPLGSACSVKSELEQQCSHGLHLLGTYPCSPPNNFCYPISQLGKLKHKEADSYIQSPIVKGRAESGRGGSSPKCVS